MRPQLLDHIEQIQSKVELMHLSARSHALIVDGPAGYGKTQAVTEALERAGLEAARLGSYSTPLNLFNFLNENQSRIVILDDVAGLFYDRAAMAILKAATWASPGGRVITWGSTTTKANADDFEFQGKLIVICNSFPATPDAIAVKSRSLTHQFQISKIAAKQLLREAAFDSKWFRNTGLATEVAEFLCEHLTDSNLPDISYRTHHIGYDAAEKKPGKWRELLGSMIQVNKGCADPKALVEDLARRGMKVREQVQVFEEMTGFKRRTFFKYRKQLGVQKVAIKVSGQLVNGR